MEKTETSINVADLPSAQTLANKHCKANVKEAEATWLCETVGAALPEWKILVEAIEKHEEQDGTVVDDNPIDNAIDKLDRAAQNESRAPARAIALERNYKFENYFQTLSFVNSIASMIHREDHHPQLTVTFNQCVVRWDTHTVKGVSLNDLICAAKCDVVFDSAAHARAK
jgi:pterin-4a-carbinolamine dehydratase